ncbi:hypothetical protein LLB_0066 [Legionella longbeachae D-4968]|nr:hypothetical protein LLB_0066 [Legionella longbeachae D-4968]
MVQAYVLLVQSKRAGNRALAAFSLSHWQVSFEDWDGHV